MVAVNKRVLFVTEPIGRAPATSDFKIVEVPFDLASTGNAPGSIVTENLFLSLDPYMRGRMKQNDQTFGPPMPLNKPFQGFGIGKVIKSTHDNYKVGDIVKGFLGWENFTVTNAPLEVANADFGTLDVIKPEAGVPLSTYLSALGMTGFTAWAGLMSLAKPQKGETVFVSSASGAVGTMVGQYAKIAGCRVVGSAGSDEKVAFLKDVLGFDDAFNYKSPPGGSLRAALAKACPKGIDVNFENVGGDTYEAVLSLMNPGGRIAVCGWISSYDGTGATFPATEKFEADKEKYKLAVNTPFSGAMFTADGTPARYMAATAQGLKDGTIKVKDDVRKGLDIAPAYFVGMLKGENHGKATIEI